VPSVDIYDSWELVTRHMPIEQPPATPTYIIFKKGEKTYGKNGLTGHIEYEDSDEADLIQTVFSSLSGKGNHVHFCTGQYYISKTITIPFIAKPSPAMGIMLTGSGCNATRLILDDNVNGNMFEYTSTEKVYFGYFRGITFDGNKENNTSGDLIHLNDKFVDFEVHDCYFRNAAGVGLYSDNTWNVRIFGNTFEGNGSHALVLKSGVDAKIIGNKFHYNGGCGIYLEDVSCSSIIGNHIYNNDQHGIQIEYVSETVEGIIIANNNFRGSSWTTANTYDQIYGRLTRTIIVGNNFCGASKSRYAINATAGTGVIAAGNTFTGHVTGVIRALNSFKQYWHIYGNEGLITENRGTATFSGDGATTTFTIAHGLADTPRTYRVQPASNDAAGDFYVTADNTNLTVTYLTAPPSGTDNIVLVWRAEI